MSTYHSEKVRVEWRATAPTMVPALFFNSRSDAEKLKTAFKGIGCDKKSVIEILCRRNNAQRLEIAETYKTLYGEDLKSRLKSETSGNLEKLLVALVTPHYDFLAEQLYSAMKGAGTDEAVLIEILTSVSNTSMKLINQRYRTLFGKTLESDIKGDTGGHFRRLCISLALGNRDDNTNVSKNIAKADAEKLYKAGVAKLGTDESTFHSILVARSFEHLRHVFEEYSFIAKHKIEEAIENEFSGDIKKGHLAIVKLVRDKNAYFAGLLHKSMKGLGTDDKTLIRIVVSRSEIDLGDIKQSFWKLYGKTLESWIQGDTSGNYKDALLTVVQCV